MQLSGRRGHVALVIGKFMLVLIFNLFVNINLIKRYKEV